MFENDPDHTEPTAIDDRCTDPEIDAYDYWGETEEGY